LASLACVRYYGLDAPALACVAMLAALPLGVLFARVERLHRQHENKAFARLVQWSAQQGGGSDPLALTRRSMLVLFPVNLLAFCFALAGLLVVVKLALALVSPWLSGVDMRWPHLWVVASIGALLSLRHRPAYAVVMVGVCVAILSRFLTV